MQQGLGVKTAGVGKRKSGDDGMETDASQVGGGTRTKDVDARTQKYIEQAGRRNHAGDMAGLGASYWYGGDAGVDIGGRQAAREAEKTEV